VSAARFALLDWNRSAGELLAQLRAVPSDSNEAAMPKMWLGELAAAVRNLQVGATRSTAAPGTLVSITPQSLGIATASHDVTLTQFMTLDGRALTVPQLVRTARLREGMVLPHFPATSLGAAVAGACDASEEMRWLGDWRCLRPIGAPFQAADLRNATSDDFAVLPGSGQGLPPGTDPVAFAFAVVLLWLARSAASERFDIGIRLAQADLLPGAHHLLADTRPFRVDADFSRSFEWFSRDCNARLTAWKKRKPYPRDAMLRDPLLGRPPGWSDFASWPVAIELPAEGRYRAPVEPSGLTLAITAGCGTVRQVRDPWRMPQRERAAAQLATLAQDCAARPWARLGSLALLPQTEFAALRSEIWGAPLR
jgi:hypothetical protein